MKNKKGFTLIELLVVITIIGIITVLALPGVQQIQARNRNKKFEAYSDTIESAGKLFTDSYSDDMFGSQGNGCYIIPYSELRGKSLIKDYETDGISCDNENTFVKVEMENGKYNYSVSLQCTKNGAIAYQSNSIAKCSGGNTDIELEQNVPQIEISWKNDDDTVDGVWSKEKEVTIKISSSTGLRDNIRISYGWSTDPNVPPTTWDEVDKNLRNVYGASSTSEIFTAGGPDKNGSYYLFVDARDVADIGERPYPKEYAVSAVMKFDNTAPTTPELLNPKANGWAGRAYVDANNFVITVNSSDPHSGVAYYQYKYPNSSTESEKEWKYIVDDSGIKKFGSTVTTQPFKKQRNEVVQIQACDQANNCSAAETMIRIDREDPTCTISLSGTKHPDAATDPEKDYYVTVVEVKLNPDDEGGSGIAYYDVTTSSTEPNPYSNTSIRKQSTVIDGTMYYGYVKDAGDNFASCQTEKFVVIAEPPKVTFSLSGKKSTATCVDGNDPTITIKTDTKDIASSLEHEVTCSDQYGLTTTAVQKFSKKTVTVTGTYSCACPGKCAAPGHSCTGVFCYSCCGYCGTSKSTTYSKNGSPIVTTSY